MEPQLSGLPAWQARMVDRIKRSAIRHLHASPRGERLLLRMYLAGEEATERTLQEELMPQPPSWLAAQVQRHLEDERRHARLFAQALRNAGGEVPAHTAPDWLSRRKIACWRSIAQRHAVHFEHGLLVPAYATGLCAEQMAERVLRRHCETIGPQHALHPLLAEVLADEAHHVRMCLQTLNRLVTAHESSRLTAMLAEIRAVDASFGISTAVAMYAAGLAYRIGWPKPRST